MVFYNVVLLCMYISKQADIKGGVKNVFQNVALFFKRTFKSKLTLTEV